MKNYTDLEQSKKLAEILPLDSADMYYDKVTKIPYYSLSGSVPKDWFIPAWSLSSLLNVLQNPSLHKTYTGWRCDTYNENCTECKLGDTADNPIDACYNMIIDLHEQNLL